MECAKENLESLINQQGKCDRLVCPEMGCGKTPSDQEIKFLIGEENFRKYKGFVRDKEVAKDRENRMWCPWPDCNTVIDLNQQFEDKIECPECKRLACRKCRQEDHGDKPCNLDRGMEAWQENMVGVETGNCPKCHTLIFKDGGCPHMTCQLCGYEFCWTCGLERHHWFHKI